MGRGVAERGTRPLLTFRLDPALWHDVRTRLANDGRTLSEVVNQGLERYVDHGNDLQATDGARVAHVPGRTEAADLTLPHDTAALLRDLRSAGDGKLLSATLAYLHDVGWPLRTLADALGVSRQAVQARVRQRVPPEVRLAVQQLGPPPLYPRQRQPMAPGVRRRPSTVQVDGELRLRARAKAWREGASLTQVVERILRTYLRPHESGTDADATTTDETATARPPRRRLRRKSPAGDGPATAGEG